MESTERVKDSGRKKKAGVKSTKWLGGKEGCVNWEKRKYVNL